VSVADRETAQQTRPRTLADQVAEHPVIATYIQLADQFTAELGYTEHGLRHANLVGRIAYNVLDRLGYQTRLAELAAVAGYLHDIGNVVSRHDHAQSGALMVLPILAELGLPATDIGVVLAAIGNHEGTGHAVSPVSAAVVIADKSDVHHSRVRKDAEIQFDIHDRVNAATRHSFVRVDPDARTITLELDIDPEISNVMEYFEIFLSRMMMCRHAAGGLGCRFRMTVNGQSLA
jgi:uncharacterized protein